MIKEISILIETQERGNVLIDKIEAFMLTLEEKGIGYYAYSDSESSYNKEGLNRYIWLDYESNNNQIQKIEVVEDYYSNSVYVYFFLDYPDNLIAEFKQNFKQITLDDLLENGIEYLNENPDRFLLLGISNDKKYDKRIEDLLIHHLKNVDSFYRSCVIMAIGLLLWPVFKEPITNQLKTESDKVNVEIMNEILGLIK